MFNIQSGIHRGEIGKPRGNSLLHFLSSLPIFLTVLHGIIILGVQTEVLGFSKKLRGDRKCDMPLVMLANVDVP